MFEFILMVQNLLEMNRLNRLDKRRQKKAKRWLRKVTIKGKRK